eukprot:CAMPEP_0172448772 /NCGR_PEP_ID=MMETSP1065-20121228/7715_1 /TAXON_ID=265537 /ORGANISM="Amphiprora paludosa, Strain CCMP125" /LENGTH=1206 /DNA_ID=CAMNT_0013200357 /DNA_START=78 /DNA_END=3698 /DNA_ORIENTATION=+
MNEEDALLASLQATRQEQDVYEDKVIRDATHQLAPTLTGREFPDLSTLVHTSSRSSSKHHGADLPQLHKVLSTVRKAQHEQLSGDGDNSNDSDLLHLKEQMLLHYMQSVAHVPKEDLPIRRNEEQWLERRKEIEKQQREPPKESTTAPSNKNQRRVSFETDGKLTPTLQPQRKRVSIMKRKQQEPAFQSDNQQATVKPSPKESKERLDELKRLRKDRLRRKKLRRRAWQDDSSVSSSEDEFGVDRRSKKRAASEPEVEPTPQHPADAVEEQEEEKKMEVNDTVFEAIDEAAAGRPQSMMCPLCQQQVEYSSEVAKDEILSQHMALCQEQQPQTRRSSRLRTRTSGFAPIAQNNDDDDDDDYEVEQVIEQPPIHSKKRKRKSTAGRAPAATPKTSPALDDLEEWVYEDRVDDWIENGLERMREMSELDGSLPGAEDYGDGLVIPAWVNDRLFGYQREGLRVMWEWHKQEAGGCLGDEMGLGKTVSISSLLGSMIACRKVHSVLLIVPATMLNHWLTELSVWAPGLRRILIHPSGEVDGISRTMTTKLLRSLDKWVRKCRANRVYECIDEDDRATLPPHSFCGTGYAIITTYESVRRNPDPYIGHDFSYVVLDEAQKIRNPDADITVACKRLRTPHRIAMSGTPIMNDLKELWSLFDFVFPNRLGTLPAFESEFADPIRKGGYSNASPMQVQLAYRCALTLKELIEPFLLRRLKKEVKEVSRMPSKTEHVLFCRLSSQQRNLYEAFLRSDAVAKVVQGSSNLLGAITMLRKICNHPDLVCEPGGNSVDKFIKNGFVDKVTSDTDDEEDYEEEIFEEETLAERSGKLEVLSKILPLWKREGHRVLLFCQWKKMLNIVQRFMMLKGWKFARLDGNTNVAARQRLVDTFNSDESYFAMLCTTRTGGVGLNLTGASRVCLYSPDWNPQIDAQARERAWRFGQKKEVTVYRLITAGTVEEKIYQRQIFKTALSNKVLQDPRQRRLFSQKDLRDLFTLKHDTGSIRNGADGVTETAEMTKGDGVVDVDDPGSGKDETLKDVMKSRGLAGVFDHDFVESSGTAKSATAREMEEQAKKVAKEAVKALQKSVASERRFTSNLSATQTGSMRFGAPSGFGRAQGIGATSSGSTGLLTSLKQREASAKLAGTDGPEAMENLSQYTDLLGRIKTFVRRQRPTTEAIMQHFSDVPTQDVAIFRRLLKSVAKLQNGRWCTKE